MTAPQSPPWPTRRGPNGLKPKIIRSLASGAETSRDIAADLEISPRRASWYLCRLVRRGVLFRKATKFFPDGPSAGNPPMVRYGLENRR